MTDARPRHGPCLVVDDLIPGEPCVQRIDHVGKHYWGDDEFRYEWLMPLYGPQRPSTPIASFNAQALAQMYGVAPGGIA